MTRAAPPADRSLLDRLHQHRYRLGAVILLLIVVATWFSDELAALFSSSPKARDIAGSWVFARSAYERSIETAIASSGDPAAAASTRRDHLLTAAAPYTGITYTFEAATFRIAGPGNTSTYPCVITGEASNVIEIRPNVEGVAPLTLVVDKERRLLHIIGPELAIPLMRAE